MAVILARIVVKVWCLGAVRQSNRAILMGDEDRLEIQNFFPQGIHLSRESIVLCAEYLNLLLKVC